MKRPQSMLRLGLSGRRYWLAGNLLSEPGHVEVNLTDNLDGEVKRLSRRFAERGGLISCNN